MVRRSLLLAAAAFLLLGATIFGGAWLLLRYQPGFYRTAGESDEERFKLSQEFVRERTRLVNALMADVGRAWYASFTDRQVNAYLSEGLFREGFDEALRQKGFSEPRVSFENGRIRLAFRYKNGLANTVISMSLRVWSPGSEPNTLAVQLECLKAGLIPFSAQWLLEQAAEPLRMSGNEVTWYRHEGMPVALIRFPTERARPSLQIKGIQVDQGVLTLNGESVASVARVRRDVAFKK
jgi:hypothetical protein